MAFGVYCPRGVPPPHLFREQVGSESRLVTLTPAESLINLPGAHLTSSQEKLVRDLGTFLWPSAYSLLFKTQGSCSETGLLSAARLVLHAADTRML